MSRGGPLALAAVAVLAAPRPAQACGGCFSPPETVTAVESHRMVVALSTTRTTLWDQIRYTGNPRDFVWVLPVPDGATTVVEVADPRFFEELEASTAPFLVPPALAPRVCPNAPASCESSAGARRIDAAAPPDAVTVFQESTVGPYETVVIGSTDAEALRTWLLDHGYQVPAETEPVLGHYIAAEQDFVVLRLAPDTGVGAMTPVRVGFTGYMATFPLKMVTVGAQGALSMTLWVIGEQRFDAANYGTFTIADADLVWDFAAGRSNYEELFAGAVEAHGGRGWIAEYASLLSWLPLSSATELEVARSGLLAPYVTRLRTRMLVDHLGDDLALAPAAQTSDITATHYVERAVNVRPQPPCPDYSSCDGGGCAAAPGGRVLGAAALFLVALLLGAAALRRSTQART